MKKLLTIILMMTLLTLAACGGNESGEEKDATSGKKQEFSILLGKPEIAPAFEAAINEYSKENNVKITVIPLAGQNAFEKMTSLYSSNNAPTIMMMAQEFDTFKDKLLDMSDQPWIENVHDGLTNFVTVDEKVYGMPVTVEAFGYIYNKSIMDKAIGEDFNPSDVKTTTDLKNLLEKVSKLEGVEGLHISPMDWSLGAHITNPMFASQSEDREARHQFMKDLKEGKVSLSDDPIFNGWLDTFDTVMPFNNAKAAPLAPVYDDGPIALGTGEVGLWFMGNWAYPQLQENDPEGEYGFLPVPISNNSEDYGNSQISVGVPSYFVVDKSQSTVDEQQAALDFLNWLVSDEKGQDYYVNQMNLIPVYKNIDIEPKDSLSKSILSYMEQGQTLEWMNLYYPADGWPTMGAVLQKYIDGKISREDVTKQFEDYWKNAK